MHPRRERGSGGGLCCSYQRAKEPTTTTPNDVIYQRRVALLAEVDRTGNVAESCQRFCLSRTRYYEWRAHADVYGPAALAPEERRRPQVPGATPTNVLEALLTLAVTCPTLASPEVV